MKGHTYSKKRPFAGKGQIGAIVQPYMMICVGSGNIHNYLKHVDGRPRRRLYQKVRRCSPRGDVLRRLNYLHRDFTSGWEAP